MTADPSKANKIRVNREGYSTMNVTSVYDIWATWRYEPYMKCALVVSRVSLVTALDGCFGYYHDQRLIFVAFPARIQYLCICRTMHRFALNEELGLLSWNSSNWTSSMNEHKRIWTALHDISSVCPTQPSKTRLRWVKRVDREKTNLPFIILSNTSIALQFKLGLNHQYSFANHPTVYFP